MTKPPPSDSDVELSSAPVNQRIQLATNTQSSSANDQSKITKPVPKQNIPASVSTPVYKGLDFFEKYINPDLPSPKSHPLLSEYQEIKSAQGIDLHSPKSHPLLSQYQEITNGK
jgi:hypothetical protein